VGATHYHHQRESYQKTMLLNYLSSIVLE